MNEHFGPDAVAPLGDGERRAAAAAEAAELGLPSIDEEAWRYSPLADLGLAALKPITKPPAAVAGSPVADGVAASVVVVDGFVSQVSVGAAAQAAGVTVGTAPDPGRLVTADERSGFDALHEAFSPGQVVVTVPRGVVVEGDIVIEHRCATTGTAAFPRTVVELGENAEATVVERLADDASGARLVVPVVELRVAAAARLTYALDQRLDRREAVVLGRLSATVGQDATLHVGYAAFGARYGRLRTDVRLAGRGATGKITAASFGTGAQVHDVRNFQHHDAPDTQSDLLFKGVQADEAGSIYTGLIHIHPDGRGSNANQTNRNIKLSDDAWAWSVPNLEIENNDVRCSHASTVSPIDEDQAFYLAARGVPPVAAQRLIVAGFFDDVLGRLPAAIAPDAAAVIADNLDRIELEETAGV